MGGLLLLAYTLSVHTIMLLHEIFIENKKIKNMMHEHSTSLMVTARMKGLLQVTKKVSAVESVICNVA